MMRTAPHRRSRGFTLIELSIALLIVALIVGAVAAGGDLQRNASYQRVSSAFVRGWHLAFISHKEKTGVVPGDTASAPTGKVNGDASELCGTALRNVMYAAGVRMPAGRAEGRETEYVYLDSNGNPQAVEVCMQYVAWSVPGSTAGSYVVQNRNVLVMKGLTPDLARLIDATLDGQADARFGSVRESIYANLADATSREWSKDNRMNYTGTADNRDESQVAVVTAYYLLDPE
ncbi:type II secretion system protein [Thauera mechernichensis]